MGWGGYSCCEGLWAGVAPLLSPICNRKKSNGLVVTQEIKKSLYVIIIYILRFLNNNLSDYSLVNKVSI